MDFSKVLPTCDEWNHLDESTFILRGNKNIFFFIFISFSEEIHKSKQNSLGWDAAFCGDTSGDMLFAYVP